MLLNQPFQKKNKSIFQIPISGFSVICRHRGDMAAIGAAAGAGAAGAVEAPSATPSPPPLIPFFQNTFDVFFNQNVCKMG